MHLSQGGGRVAPILVWMLWLGSASLDLLVTGSASSLQKAGASLLGQKPGIRLVCHAHALCFPCAVLGRLSLSSQLLHGLGFLSAHSVLTCAHPDDKCQVKSL